MSDLRQLLRDAAQPAGDLDLTAVRARSDVRSRRQRATRAAGVAFAVLIVGGGALLSVGDGSDGTTVTADRPDDQTVTDAQDDGNDPVDDGLPGEDGTGPAVGPLTPSTITTSPLEPTPQPEPGSEGDEVPGGNDSDGAVAPATTTTAAPLPPAERSLRFDDPAGDTSRDPRVPTTTRHPEPQLDLVGASLAVKEDVLVTEIDVVDLEDEAPQGANGTLFRFLFTYETGEQRHQIIVDVQRFNGSQFIRFDGDFGSRVCDGCTATFDAAADTVRGVVPLSALEDLVEQFGGGSAGPGVRLSEPAAQSGWVNSPTSARDCEDPSSGSVCSSSSAVADNAEGTGSITLR